MKYLCWLVIYSLSVAQLACDSQPTPSPSSAPTTESAPGDPGTRGAAEAADPPSEPGEQLSPTDETTPTTEAHPEFPNEEKDLISPEGQKIIDDVNAGRIQQPPMRGDFDPKVDSYDAADDTEEPADDAEISEEERAACKVGTMKKVHKSSMSKFLKHRKAKYCGFNYSTDGCSWSPDTGPAFDFRYSCWRHDFGYRNYKKFKIFTKKNKKVIDDKFLSDTKAHCSKRALPLKPLCYRNAYIYYGFVRKFGD